MIEKSLVVIKPDAVARGLIGEIISRFEKRGLKVKAMKMVQVDEEFAKKHYFDVAQRHSPEILKNLTDYFQEGPMVALCMEGVNAIEVIRKMAGSTYPGEALPGTIRGDFAHISKHYANNNDKRVGNLIHASANAEEAKYELNLWFKENELHNYKIAHEEHVM